MPTARDPNPPDGNGQPPGLDILAQAEQVAAAAGGLPAPPPARPPLEEAIALGQEALAAERPTWEYVMVLHERRCELAQMARALARAARYDEGVKRHISPLMAEVDRLGREIDTQLGAL